MYGRLWVFFLWPRSPSHLNKDLLLLLARHTTTSKSMLSGAEEAERERVADHRSARSPQPPPVRCCVAPCF